MRTIFLFFILSFFFTSLTGQTFKAYAVTGLNASQIDGDFDAGYNKIGLTGGIGIGFNINKTMFVSTEFLYSGRGSTNSIITSTTEPNGSIHLDYIELPIMLRIGDWYQEEDKYNKVWLELGASVGRLINANVKGSNVPEIVNDFRSTDVSYIGGLGYHMNKNFFVNLRYTRSFFPLYRNPDAMPQEVAYFTSYYISLRVGYSL